MNYDQLKFDMPPFSILFYATSIVCLLLILALWKLYQRNEFLADLAETRKLLAKESALHASEALSIGQQSLNALQTANKSTQRWQELNYELSEKLAAADGKILHKNVMIGQLQKEISDTEDARAYLEKGHNSLLVKYNALSRKVKAYGMEENISRAERLRR